MIINDFYTVEISEISISYESGIAWRNVGANTFAIDYGISTDHLSAEITCTGTTNSIVYLHTYLQNYLSNDITVKCSNEKIFGCAYRYDTPITALLSELGNPSHAQKNVSSLSMRLAIAPYLLTFAQSPTPLNLSKFAVQSTNRSFNQSINSMKTMVGYTGINHGWQRPELSISLNGNSNDAGALINWIVNNRATPFIIVANSSLILINTNYEQHVTCTSFSVKPMGYGDRWDVTLHLVRK